MGNTAENIAEKYNISREEQDIFALESQNKAQKSIREHRFYEEIFKLQIKKDNKDILFEKDEHPRKNMSIEYLKNLKPAFKKKGTVTAGNSSGINDGAAAIVMMSRDEAEKKSLSSLVKIVSWATCGVQPSLMGLGPISAVNLALKRAAWDIKEVDLFEVNEAFAPVPLSWAIELKADMGKLNVNGGAMALGHPLGATGAKLMTTLLHELERTNGKYGLQAICEGGGTANATIIERI